MGKSGTVGDEAGREVLKQVGVLEEAAKDLKQHKKERGVDPDEVGTWITAIGKALLAIFKP